MDGIHSLIGFLSVHIRLSAQYSLLKQALNFSNHLINVLQTPKDTSLSHLYVHLETLTLIFGMCFPNLSLRQFFCVIETIAFACNL